MTDTYSDTMIAGMMAWMHFAILFVPMMIATMYFEYEEWRVAHPSSRQVRRSRLTDLQGPWKPTSPFVVPM